MREIPSSAITETVAKLCEQANLKLPCGMRECISGSIQREESELCRSVLGDIVSNIDCAAELGVPICQDTGMAVIFADIGQDVHITGDAFEDAVNAGVAQGYVNGKLRLSIVGDPLERRNTNNNTPAVIHTRIVPGDKIHLMAAPKGFGSENMSRIFMLKPADGIEGVKQAVIRAVKDAGPNACPPMVIGVGIGGTFEKCALLANYLLTRMNFNRTNVTRAAACKRNHTFSAATGVSVLKHFVFRK